MSKLMKAAGVAGFLMAASVAVSPSLRATQVDNSVQENQAVTTQLGANATAISYWASTPGGWHVVTTVDTVTGKDTDAEQHAIVRFSATLMPGQEQLVSVPSALGEEQQVLRIRRVGDQIQTTRISDPSI
jgi:hypothetical protein